MRHWVCCTKSAFVKRLEDSMMSYVNFKKDQASKKKKSVTARKTTLNYRMLAGLE